MLNQTDKNNVDTLKERKGIFGFGFSMNNNLDLMNLVVLACAGIIIKIFFQENYTKLGDVGPATTTIWGYGLTATALFIMIFMSIYLSRKTAENEDAKNKNIFETNQNTFSFYMNLLFNDTIPIVLTFALIVYIISLNFTYFKRINSNTVSDSYHSYSFFLALLLIIQVTLIVKYMFNLLNRINSGLTNSQQNKEYNAIKSVTYVLATINFIFAFIIHILLSFFSTDG
jgi:hypothetical protein